MAMTKEQRERIHKQISRNRPISPYYARLMENEINTLEELITRATALVTLLFRDYEYPTVTLGKSMLDTYAELVNRVDGGGE